MIRLTLSAMVMTLALSSSVGAQWLGMMMPPTQTCRLQAVSGLALLLDAQIPGSITASSGRVTAWADQSGFGRHALATGDARPYLDTEALNGVSVPRFAGTQGMFPSPLVTLRGSGGITMVALARTSSPTTRQALIDGGKYSSANKPSAAVIEVNTYNTMGSKWGLWAADNAFDAGAETSTAWRLVVVSSTTTPLASVLGSTSYRVDGGASALTVRQSGTAWANPVPLGTGYGVGGWTGGFVNGWIGGIAAVAMWSRALTVGEIQYVEGCLAWQYGIASSLPVGHPYRAEIPGGAP